MTNVHSHQELDDAAILAVIVLPTKLVRAERCIRLNLIGIPPRNRTRPLRHGGGSTRAAKLFTSASTLRGRRASGELRFQRFRWEPSLSAKSSQPARRECAHRRTTSVSTSTSLRRRGFSMLGRFGLRYTRMRKSGSPASVRADWTAGSKLCPPSARFDNRGSHDFDLCDRSAIRQSGHPDRSWFAQARSSSIWVGRRRCLTLRVSVRSGRLDGPPL